MAKVSKKIRESIITDLKSKKAKDVMLAVKKLRDRGDASFIPDLLNVLVSTENVETQGLLTQLLFELKDQKAVEELVTQLKNPTFRPIRTVMLSACWQSGIDVSHRLPDLMEVVEIGDYLVCLELLTVIENWNQVADQNMLQKELKSLRAHMAESDMTDSEELIWAMIEELEKFVVQ